MKLRAFAIIAALATPALAIATPADNPPTNNAPTTNPNPDRSPPRGTSSDTSTGKTTGGDMNKGAKLGDADVKTISHLHHVNQMEITLAHEALKQGTAHVKDYANTLVSDHQSADKDLTAFAKAHKLATIPADKPTTDAERQDEKDMTTSMAHLKTLKGADFDKAYLNMMASDHDKELTRIDVAISATSDPDLKSLLQTVKPVLQRHADQARDLQKSPQASSNPSPSGAATPSSTQPPTSH
jgi:putative membrane protein